MAEPVVAGLEEAVCGSEVNLDCLLWGGVTYVLLHCASELIPCRQSCSAPRLVCKDKCLKAVACTVVVEPRVPHWSLTELGYYAIK